MCEGHVLIASTGKVRGPKVTSITRSVDAQGLFRLAVQVVYRCPSTNEHALPSTHTHRHTSHTHTHKRSGQLRERKVQGSRFRFGDSEPRCFRIKEAQLFSTCSVVVCVCLCVCVFECEDATLNRGKSSFIISLSLFVEQQRAGVLGNASVPRASSKSSFVVFIFNWLNKLVQQLQ